MDYSLYFETLQRTALQQVDTWAKVVVIILASVFVLSTITGLVNIAIAATLHGRNWDQEFKHYKVTFITLIVATVFLALSFIFPLVAPTHDSGEYKYEATLTKTFDLAAFENDERFTNVEYFNGKLKFKSYEYIEEIE